MAQEAKREIGLRKKIVEICKRLYDKNMLAAADGNISYRINDNRILITPSGVAKAFIDIDEIAVVNLEGEEISGKASSELSMHLQVYRQCSEASAVIHAHPPYAIAWSIAYPELKELPADCMSELILSVGKIPVVPFARPGTEQMGENLKSYLDQSRLMILARHGALSWGEDLEEAYRGMNRLEHSVQILTYAKQLGGLTSLPAEEVTWLKEMRVKLGNKTL